MWSISVQKLLVVIEWWIISFVFLHNMVATVQVAGGEIFYNLALTGLDHFFFIFSWSLNRLSRDMDWGTLPYSQLSLKVMSQETMQRPFSGNTALSGNVGTMLQPFETMSQQCCNAVWRWKLWLRIVPCNTTSRRIHTFRTGILMCRS